ncbi:hypothetical protein Pmani_004588 [Petrolisthes manimaculis]|uniref:Major facilitator superfamily (MFS) profile domain-containing protein n=1 Tax=Petrolisthes manimaculis TaxID=1843537 RepID=A0AAE1UHF6_9EUCA|nr:hypothetical protein Pmani_004588 [Petrolisthes manimaculis]
MVRRNTSSIVHVKAQCYSHVQGIGHNISDMTSKDELTSIDPAGNNTGSPALLADSHHGEMEGELDWDEITQGLVLGAFFYGYWATQVTGGRLSEVYGTRVVFGVCVFAGGVSAVFTPLAARWHYMALFALRVIQGLFQGASLPCIFPLMIRWFPPLERARFIAYVLFCNNISITATLPLCGLVIGTLGWPAAFYVTATLSFAWCFLWYFCMYDEPDQHPSLYVLQNGMLSALPFLCRYLGAVVAATVGEKLLIHKVLSVITTRRIFSAIAMFGPAVNLLVVSFSGCQPTTVIVVLCLGFFFNGSITIGLFANRVDISNNFTGTLSGIVNGSANAIAFVVPLVVGALTQNQQTMGQWQKREIRIPLPRRCHIYTRGIIIEVKERIVATVGGNL